MSRPLERIYLTPVTKGNSSLQEDPSIQMDANTRTFRKICHPVLLLSQHQSEKKAPKPNIFHTGTRLGSAEERLLPALDLIPQVQCAPLTKPAGRKCCFPVTSDQCHDPAGDLIPPNPQKGSPKLSDNCQFMLMNSQGHQGIFTQRCSGD